MDTNTKDKKGYKKYIVVLSIIVLLIGITYAVQTSSSIFNATTATLGLDTSAYGSNTFDATNLKFIPVLDSEVGEDETANNVIKIEFTVGGASGNDTSKDIIYDIALVDLDVSCELLSPYVKWKLVKDGTTLSSGSLDYKFDTIKSGRLVLTETQLDLPDYNASKTGYDNYTFYMWISDSCQSDLATCAANGTVHDQSDLLNKVLAGKIEVELYTSTKKTLVRNPSNTLDTSTCFIVAKNKIEKLYNDGSTINTVYIGGDSSNPQVNLNATQGIMLDNNGDYRYYGADPNNYVTFNGETWRIIGVFNNVDDGTGTKETRLKIIRNESIGDYSYDSSSSTVNDGYGVNDWSKADLNTELNSLYYNSTSGTCYNGSNNASTTCDFTSIGLGSEARNMIDNVIYYLGGTLESDGLYANDYYAFEKGTTVHECSTFDDGACPRATTWTGKVGLMYPSDYAYATDLSVCGSDGIRYNYTTCQSNNWLHNSARQWTIAPSAVSAFQVFYVYSSGYVAYNDASLAYGVRPAAYLKSNIAIVSGEGTISSPYQLKLT